MLLVVGAIAILAGIVILAINPAKQIGDTRNARRRADVNTILNAVYQYFVDNGSVPSTITTSSTVICDTGVSCSGIDLSALTSGEKYLVSIPVDPTQASTTLVTGYYIYKDTNNRITVTAPNAENSVTISATR